MGMIQSELKKNIISIYFVFSVFLLYVLFLMGDTGPFYADNSSVTIIGAIWGRLHGKWNISVASSFLVQMDGMWTGNPYLSVMMPLVCGLPGAMVYLEEIKTGNKKFLLARSSLRQYHVSKIVANLISSVLTSLFSISLFYVTLVFFFDRISPSQDFDIFQIVYVSFCGKLVEDVGGISYLLIVCILLKSILYFSLYSMVCASFCYCMAVWCKDKYIAFGSTIFLCYLQSRIEEEVARIYVTEGVAAAKIPADILDPVFLHYAGRSGFYQNKEALAVLLAILLVSLYCFMMIHLSKRQFDVSEG